MIPLPTVDVLDSISIPVTCPVSWDEMHGDHRTRFCNKCSQNVHDLSELTASAAVQLVTGGDKAPCLRLFRRQDGRVMTSDCMTRRQRAWKWLHRRSAWAAAVFALVFLGCEERCTRTMGVPLTHYPELPSPAPHEDEQASRLPGPGEHTPAVSRMEADAKAESAIRHESATGQ